ncbi:hypothetical protein ROHU_029538 [Labeo rohita]|uniref:Uncharacterized protein n=1 Tax=Labeo rohita TaxID=84645 RepID=A0A498LVJ6_LABRO|nr:hypothetical protein ROHU_029538 [Labeo rohita]
MTSIFSSLVVLEDLTLGVSSPVVLEDLTLGLLSLVVLRRIDSGLRLCNEVTQSHSFCPNKEGGLRLLPQGCSACVDHSRARCSPGVLRAHFSPGILRARSSLGTLSPLASCTAGSALAFYSVSPCGFLF